MPLCSDLPLYGTAAEIRRRLLHQLEGSTDSRACQAFRDLTRWVTDEDDVRGRLLEETGRHLPHDRFGAAGEVPAGLIVSIEVERDQALPLTLRAVYREELGLRFHFARISTPIRSGDTLQAAYRVERS